VVGVLSFLTTREQGFSAEDMAIATAFASHAAIALENSRLLLESRRAYDELAETQGQLDAGPEGWTRSAASRWSRARLQQPAHRLPSAHRHLAAPAEAGGSDAARHRADPAAPPAARPT